MQYEVSCFETTSLKPQRVQDLVAHQIAHQNFKCTFNHGMVLLHKERYPGCNNHAVYNFCKCQPCSKWLNDAQGYGRLFRTAFVTQQVTETDFRH